MEQKELETILEEHKLWVETDGEKGKRADLYRSDLSGVDLSGADLSGADLRGADLCVAYLCGADLCGADLSGADLRDAVLSGADLRGAVLNGADLSGADLCRASLCDANLSGADLQGVKSFWDTVGNGKEIKSVQLGRYNICYTKNLLQIGCKLFLIEEWKEFSDEEIFEFDEGYKQEGLAWWRENKEKIFKTIEKFPAE